MEKHFPKRPFVIDYRLEHSLEVDCIEFEEILHTFVV